MSRGILIVEDHPAVKERVRLALEGAGWQVCGEAGNGQEAIEKTRALQPDLVILNLSMPVMTGFEALPVILQCRPQPKVLVFTVHGEEEVKREALRLGAHGFATKGGDELIGEVRRLLGENP